MASCSFCVVGSAVDVFPGAHKTRASVRRPIRRFMCSPFSVEKHYVLRFANIDAMLTDPKQLPSEAHLEDEVLRPQISRRAAEFCQLGFGAVDFKFCQRGELEEFAQQGTNVLDVRQRCIPSR